MLVIMRKTATEEQIQATKQYLADQDCDFHQSTGADRVIIGVVGGTDNVDKECLVTLDGVLDVYKIPKEE